MFSTKKVISRSTLIALMLASGALYADAPAFDVNVVNTPEINVANEPNVNVLNMPALKITNTPDVSVVNTPDVNVVSMPTPVETVVCVSNMFGDVDLDPYSAGMWNLNPKAFRCPSGVTSIDVQRIAVYVRPPDTHSIAKFRFTVAFGATPDFDPLGFVATLTDGMPTASVGQSFFLNTDGSSRLRVGVSGYAFSGLADHNVAYDAWLFFIGTPSP